MPQHLNAKTAPVPIRLDCGHVGAMIVVGVPVDAEPANTTSTAIPGPQAPEVSIFRLADLHGSQPAIVSAECVTCQATQQINTPF